MYYSLAAAKSDFHRKLLDCLSACFNDVPELKKDANRRERFTDRLLAREGAVDFGGVKSVTPWSWAPRITEAAVFLSTPEPYAQTKFMQPRPRAETSSCPSLRVSR
jgi:hypothetical protein